MICLPFDSLGSNFVVSNLKKWTISVFGSPLNFLRGGVAKRESGSKRKRIRQNEEHGLGSRLSLGIICGPDRLRYEVKESKYVCVCGGGGWYSIGFD